MAQHGESLYGAIEQAEDNRAAVAGASMILVLGQAQA
jgi:hypothetical protein